jgi:hypothetical protein
MGALARARGEFEVKDGRTEEHAIAAMHEAFSGQEF